VEYQRPTRQASRCRCGLAIPMRYHLHLSLPDQPCDRRPAGLALGHLDVQKLVGSFSEQSEQGQGNCAEESGRAQETINGALISPSRRLGAFGRECSFTYTLINASDGALISLRRLGFRSVADTRISRCSRPRFFLTGSRPLRFFSPSRSTSHHVLR